MAETSLKAVVSLDKDTGEYKPAAHNLSADEAVERVNRLHQEQIHAAILEQPNRHRSLNFNRCRLCREAADGFTKQHREKSGEEDQVKVSAAAANESEEE